MTALGRGRGGVALTVDRRPLRRHAHGARSGRRSRSWRRCSRCTGSRRPACSSRDRVRRGDAHRRRDAAGRRRDPRALVLRLPRVLRGVRPLLVARRPSCSRRSSASAPSACSARARCRRCRPRTARPRSPCSASASLIFVLLACACAAHVPADAAPVADLLVVVGLVWLGTSLVAALTHHLPAARLVARPHVRARRDPDRRHPGRARPRAHGPVAAARR